MGDKLIYIINFLLILSSFLFSIEIRVSLSNPGEILNGFNELFVSCEGDLILNGRNLGKTELQIQLVHDELMVKSKNKVITRGIFEHVSCSNGYVKINTGRRVYSFPGSMVFHPRNGRLFLINELDFEEYIELVLPYEMGWKAGLEALKAQAVLARTYALLKINSSIYSKYGYDICSSVTCQVYRGIPNVKPSKMRKYERAVRDTSGITLKYGDKLARVFFSSHNGGRSALPSEIWGGNIPYILTFDDKGEDGIPYGAFSDYYSWVVSIPRMEILRKLSKSEKTFVGSRLKKIEILDRGPSGRVTKLKIIGDREIEIDGNSFRLIVGLRSSFFDLQFDPISDEYIFWGRGFGHGVGLSQYGAMDMAERGYEYDEILEHYFPGTMLSGSIEVVLENYEEDLKDLITIEVDGRKFNVDGFKTLIPNVSLGVRKVSLNLDGFEIATKRILVFEGKKSVVFFRLGIGTLPTLVESKDEGALPKFTVKYSNYPDGVLVRVNFDKAVDFAKLILLRKSGVNGEWLRLFERKLEGERKIEFFDYTVDLSGKYEYKVILVSNDYSATSYPYFFTVFRDFKVEKIAEKKRLKLPFLRMPDLGEDELIVKSLVMDNLDYVDIDVVDDTDLFADGKKILKMEKGERVRFGKIDGKIALFGVNGRILSSEVELKGVFNFMDEEFDHILIALRRGKIRLLNVETLENYLIRNLEGFIERNDSIELRRLKAIILRTHVVYSLLTGRYAGEDHDLLYRLSAFQITNEKTPSWKLRNCLRETKNRVITTAGFVVDGLFNRSNSGVKAKDDIRWYLEDGKDRFSGKSEWNRVYTSSEIGKMISRMCDIGDVVKIEIKKRDEYKRVVELKLTGKRGVKILKGENIWKVLQLPSSIFKVTKVGDEFKFDGEGFGNFIGISLQSARKMLELGWNVKDVVDEYYLMADILPFNRRASMDRAMLSQDMVEMLELIPTFGTFGKIEFSRYNPNEMSLKYNLDRERTAGILLGILIPNENLLPRILIHGDGSENFLRYDVIDSDGEPLVGPMVKLGSGKVEVKIDPRRLKLKEWVNFDKKDGKIDFPIIVRSIYIVKSSNSKEYGNITIEILN